LEKYGADPLRYYCLAKTPPFADGDFSEKKFIETYNADLANGLGNLISRVAKLCANFEFPPTKTSLLPEIKTRLNQYRFDEALKFIWDKVKSLDQLIEQEKPWTKDGQELKTVLDKLVPEIRQIGFDLQPFLPETANKIRKQFAGPIITGKTGLFPRI